MGKGEVFRMAAVLVGPDRVDVLHKKQGEKVLKTENFWLDFPGLFMI